MTALGHDYVYSYTLGFLIPTSCIVFAVLTLMAVALPALGMSAGKDAADATAREVTAASFYPRMAFAMVFNMIPGVLAAIEYWARVNCPTTDPPLHPVRDFMTYRSLSCVSFDVQLWR